MQKLCEMANELKNASVLPETLLQTGQEGLLGEKLKEVAYILQAYDALLKRAITTRPTI